MNSLAKACPRCSNRSWHEEKPLVYVDPLMSQGIKHAQEVRLVCDRCGWINAAFTSIFPKPFDAVHAAKKIIFKQ